jgi:ABC-type branched-subunit amino acid transport system permease subunit
VVFAHILGLAVLAALLPLAVSWLGFVFTVAIGKGLAALGVAILLRAGMISIGHALFFAIGAYAIAFLMRDAAIGELVTLLACATLITAAAGLIVGAFMVRYRGIFFAMLNLAVSMVFFTLLSKLYRLTGGTDGMRVPTPSLLGMELSRPAFEQALYLIAIAIMVAVALLTDRYLKSPLGQALSAIDANEVRLEFIGVSARGVLLVAYMASAALAGLGGALSAVAIGHVVPEFSYWTLSGQLVLIAVLGGIGGVPGAFIGAFFLELVRTFAVGFAADAWNAIIGISLLVVIFFLPEGLFGLLQRLETRMRGPRS